MSIYQLYRSSLKPVELEEWVDLAFFRPLGFIFALLFYRTPISPNMVTVISASVGAVSGYLVSKGTTEMVLYGAGCYLLSNILDCTDGMLARMTGKYSRLGQVFDGVADYVVGVSIFAGIGIGMQPEGMSTAIWWSLLVVGGMMATTHQSMHLNHVREAALAAMARGRGEIRRTAPKHVNRKLFQRRQFFLFIFLALYDSYLLGEKTVRKLIPMPEKLPAMNNIPVEFRMSMMLWTFTGKGTHVALLTIFIILQRPELYCLALLLPGYTFIILAWFYHHHALKTLPD